MTFWVAGATAVGGIGSALIQSSAQRKAARAQQQAIAEARQVSQEKLSPYEKYGPAAYEQLSNYLGIGGDVNAPNYGRLTRDFSLADFQADPGYQFRLKEGLKTLQRNAAARGGALSGRTLLGAERFGQDLASQEYGSAYNRYRQQKEDLYNKLLGERDFGYKVAGDIAGNEMNLALGKGNVAAQSAQAQGDLYANMLKSITGAVGGGVSQYQQNQLDQQRYNDLLSAIKSQPTQMPSSVNNASTYNPYSAKYNI